MADARFPGEPRGRLTVDNDRRGGDEHVWRGRIDAASADHQHVVGGWIERLLGIDDDHRTVKAQGELTLVVPNTEAPIHTADFARAADEDAAYDTMLDAGAAMALTVASVAASEEDVAALRVRKGELAQAAAGAM